LTARICTFINNRPTSQALPAVWGGLLAGGHAMNGHFYKKIAQPCTIYKKMSYLCPKLSTAYIKAMITP